MSRPQRNNVDYFPFLCKEGNTTKYIDNTYGNDGFATWTRLLRALAITDYHYLDLSNRKNLLTFCSTCKITEERLITILNDLAEFGEIDEELWKDRIVWSDQFTDSIADAYAKRSNKVISKEELLQLLEGLGIRKRPKRKSKGAVNPQSKVEKSIVKESKEEQSKEELEAAPSGATHEQRAAEFMGKVADYINDYPKELLRRFYDYWTEMNDGGRKMRFEMQKVFDIKKRLNTWARNERGTKNNNNGSGVNARRQAFAERHGVGDQSEPV